MQTAREHGVVFNRQVHNTSEAKLSLIMWDMYRYELPLSPSVSGQLAVCVTLAYGAHARMSARMPARFPLYQKLSMKVDHSAMTGDHERIGSVVGFFC